MNYNTEIRLVAYRFQDGMLQCGLLENNDQFSIPTINCQDEESLIDDIKNGIESTFGAKVKNHQISQLSPIKNVDEKLIILPYSVILTPSNTKKVKGSVQWCTVTEQRYVTKSQVNIRNKMSQNDREIIDYSLDNFKNDIELNNHLFYLLNEEFILSDALQLYKVINPTRFYKYNTSNFKTCFIKYLEKTDEVSKGKRGKPGSLYRMAK